jgi:hypothetical protein
MAAASKEKSSSMGVLLLSHIREAFAAAEGISMADLLSKLHSMDTAPWANIKGQAIDGRFLSRVLRKYEIGASHAVRVEGQVVRGFMRGDFYDAWERYLPATTTDAPTTDIHKTKESHDANAIF